MLSWCALWRGPDERLWFDAPLFSVLDEVRRHVRGCGMADELGGFGPGQGLEKAKDRLRYKKYLKQQSEYVAAHLHEIITATKFPGPRGDYKLNRGSRENMDPRSRERRWEQAIWQRWRRTNAKPLPGCWHRIVSYQVPLFSSSDKDSWGAIDLLGVATDGCPVVLELKKEPRVREAKGEASSETPLRMVLEAAAYAVLLRQIWPDFRSQYVERLRNVGVEEPIIAKVPNELSTVRLVGVAPREYWLQWLPLSSKGLAIDPATWDAFRRLLDTLAQEDLPVTFAAVVGDLQHPSRLQAGWLKGYPLG